VVELAHDIVAIAEAAARAALAHPALETAMDLLAQIFEEERVHCPLEADV
jgi:hypothetical protein